MPILRIESVADPRLAPYRSLKMTNATRWTGRFVAEGDKLVCRLLESDFAVQSLLLGERDVSQFSAIAGESIEILIVPDAWVEEIVGFNFHRGVLACAHRKPNLNLLSFCRAYPQRLTLVVWLDVQDPENLGAVLRISGACGVDAIVLGPGCCDPLSRRVLRVSMGAAFKLPILQTEDLAAELAQIQNACQVQLWASVVSPAASPFNWLPRPERLGLLLGSEGHRLAAIWLEMCDQQVTIPMQRGTDSLNVAVTAGILLYRFTR